MTFTIYTSNGCGYCEQIKAVLLNLNLSFTEQRLDADFSREQFTEQFGYGATFPRVLMDGRLLGGCNETITYLRNQGLV